MSHQSQSLLRLCRKSVPSGLHQQAIPIGQGAKLSARAKAYMNRAEELFSRIE